jgi:DHA3 family macrolide efflux protein-like MFS transporter
VIEGLGRPASAEAAAAAKPSPVLANRHFSYLWLAQLLSQTAQNAILFALLVLVVDITGSSTQGSLLVLSYVVPSALFGMVAGLLVDRWRKRGVFIATTVSRAVAAVAFFFVSGDVWLIYAVMLGFSTMSQFFVTAETAAIPSLVPRHQLMAANSMFNLALTGSQFVGMVVLAPLFLKTYGSDALFITGAAVFLIAGALVYWLPEIGEEAGETNNARNRNQKAITELAQALRLIRADSASYMAMLQMTLSSSLVLLFAVLVPRYMQQVLQVPPDNAAFVFAPVGIGAILGLRLLPFLVARLGKSQVVILGLLGLVVSLVALGFVERIADVLEGTENLNPFAAERFGGLSILVTLTMAFAGPLGLFYALVNAPAQTVLHERAPAEMRGRVFASQLVLANLVSILPLLLAGGIADLYGVSPILLAIAGVVLVAAGFSFLLSGREPSAEAVVAASVGLNASTGDGVADAGGGASSVDSTKGLG